MSVFTSGAISDIFMASSYLTSVSVMSLDPFEGLGVSSSVSDKDLVPLESASLSIVSSVDSSSVTSSACDLLIMDLSNASISDLVFSSTLTYFSPSVVSVLFQKALSLSTAYVSGPVFRGLM